MSILLDVEVHRQFVSDVAEHETLIAWNNDTQNAAFQNWLWAEGFPAFEIWYEQNKGDYE